MPTSLLTAFALAFSSNDDWPQYNGVASDRISAFDVVMGEPIPGKGELLTRMVAYDAFTQIFPNPLLAEAIHDARTFSAYGMEVIEATDTIQTLVDRNLKPGTKARAKLERIIGSLSARRPPRRGNWSCLQHRIAGRMPDRR